MLRTERHNLIGLTMQLWNQRRLAGHEGMPEAVHGRCCSLDDVYDARRVAETLGIPYHVVNHEDRFERDVVRPLVSAAEMKSVTSEHQKPRPSGAWTGHPSELG